MNEQLLKMNGLSVGILDALSFESHLGIPLKKNLHYFDKDLLIAELISMTEWLDEQEILSNIALDYRVKSLDGFYYGLSGSTYHRSKDTIHSYLAMRKVGLSIKIYDGLKMAARFEETDMIGIVPQGRSTSYVDRIMQYEIMDICSILESQESVLLV